VERPNRLLSEQLGGASGLAFYYDGKTMTLAWQGEQQLYDGAGADDDRRDHRQGPQAVPESKLPGPICLYSRPYEILTEQVTGRQIHRT
jgi:hypothetical protein